MRCVVAGAALSLAGCSRASTHGARFYGAKTYGSEAQFNPLSQLLNEGFNNLTLYSADLGIARQPYRKSLANLGHALANVNDAYRRYGWRRALTNEFFPATGLEGGQWLPNYQDHLFGSGMVSVRLEEWFRFQQVPMPALMSYLTMTASHALNEVVEQPNPLSVDALTDLLVFDNLGFLLWRSGRLQQALSGRVSLTSWALQPVFTGPTGSIENTGQSFVLRFPLPRTSRWRGIYYYGVNHVLGVSRSMGHGRWLSAGLGAGSNVVVVSDSATDTRTVSLGPRLGVFYDRENSLLASLMVENSRGTLATVNVYPGLLRIAGSSPGIWLAIRKRGGHRVGLTMPLGLGAGYGKGQVR